MARTKQTAFKRPSPAFGGAAFGAAAFGAPAFGAPAPRARSRSPHGAEQETNAATDAAGAEQNKAAALMREKLKAEPVVVKTMRPGDGTTFPKEGDQLVMHFSGTVLKEGRQPPSFDSSWTRQKPFSFRIGTGEVIKGWDEGLLRMSQGEKATLGVRSDYAYGKAGAGCIPPYSDLCYEVELLKVG